MMTKYWLILAVTLVAIAALLLPACSNENATTTVTATTTATATTTVTATPTVPPTPTVKPITLKWAYDMPLKVAISASWHDYADEVTKQTNGKVKFDFYPAAVLFGAANSPTSVKARIADIALA